MVKVEKVIVTERFERDIKKLKNGALKRKIKKQIKKLIQHPYIGKSLRYSLKGERSIHVKPFRLIYKIDGEKLILLRFEHRKKVYKS